MRTFIVNYSAPKEYRGTYRVSVEDGLMAGINASEKVQKYLQEKYGKVKDSASTVIEVYGGDIVTNY